MTFASRDEYTKWVFRTFISPYRRSWQKTMPSLTPIFSPEVLPVDAPGVPLVATLGCGVVGSVQISLHPRFKGPVIWIAASRAERMALRRLLVKPQVVVVPYPLDNERLTAARLRRGTAAWQRMRASFFSRHRLDPGLPLFFYCGRITPSKGIHHLIALAEKQRVPIQLALAGMREPEACDAKDESSFWRAVKHSSFCRTIDLGRISPAQNYLYLTFADSAVALSTDATEDFGFFPRQALALGTPTLLAAWGGLRDIRIPPTLDKKLIRRFSVKLDSDHRCAPDLSSFDLKRYVSGHGQLTPDDRERGATALLRQNQQATLSGLKAAISLRSRLLSDRRSRAAAEVRFRPLSYRIVLAGGAEGMLNAALHFPRREQHRIMSGRTR